MLLRESVSLEYKEQVSSSYLKTVSAFANFGTGRVVFGVDDGRRVVGLDDPVGDALRIENAINDSIDPRPTFSLQADLLPAGRRSCANRDAPRPRRHPQALPLQGEGVQEK